MKNIMKLFSIGMIALGFALPAWAQAPATTLAATPAAPATPAASVDCTRIDADRTNPRQVREQGQAASATPATAAGAASADGQQ